MNNTITEKYNDDFNTALDIYQNSYPHGYLINLLKNGTVAQKQAAALKLDRINTPDEANIFIQNLTGCDGKIREAVSFRLKEFTPDNPDFFVGYPEILLNAIIDINGNICRNTIEAIKSLKNNKIFTNIFCHMLQKKTLDLSETAKTFNLQEGKYKINKEIFKLYWYLETISEFANFIDKQTLLKILTNTKNIQDYTIREKTAKILSTIKNNKDFLNIKNELKDDPNYYVRRLWAIIY